MSTNIYTITSPVMGVFYQASAPGEALLIEVGRQINVSDVVCIIESMKILRN